MGYYFKIFFERACSILDEFLSNFFSTQFIKVQRVQQHSCTDTATTWNNSRFILPESLNILTDGYFCKYLEPVLGKIWLRVNI